MSGPIRVLVLDALSESRQLTSRILGFDPEIVVAGHADSLEALLPLLETCQPDVVLVSDPVRDEETPRAIWQITSRARHVGVLVISPHSEPEAMRRCMVAGARGFLARPLDHRELRTTVKDIYARILEERDAHTRNLTAPTGPLQLPRGRAPAYLIAVFGAKGGVGKTTIAVNLAVALRQHTGGGVALVDADLGLGDAGLCLDLTPAHTILDLIEAIDHEPDAELDSEIVKGVMARYEPAGLRVLLGPPRPEHADWVTPEHLSRILETLRHLFDYVIVDCPAGYDERLLAILDQADQILFVVAPEVGALKNARNFLDLSEALGFTRDRVQIILNRANSQVSITPDDVERWLAYPVSHQLVSGGAAVTEAANRGRPIVVESPQHPVSRQILALVEAVRRAATLTRQARASSEGQRAG